MENQIDFVDSQILECLRKDGRLPYSQIASRLKISNSLVHQRIKKLTDKGIIQSTAVLLDERKLGFNTKTFVGIRLKEARFGMQVVEALKKFPEIVECNLVSGGYAILISVYTKDDKSLHQLLFHKVHLIEGVLSTNTFLCFDTPFKRNVPLQNDNNK